VNSLQGLTKQRGSDVFLEIPLRGQNKTSRVRVAASKTVRQFAHCPKWALNFACYLRCEAPLQIFANQSNCRLTCHAHDLAPENWVLPVISLEHAIEPKPHVDGSLSNQLIQND